MIEKKRKLLPGRLFVLATPIGCLEDLSPRARRILLEVPILGCEDTREGKKLLDSIGGGSGSKTWLRMDEHTRESEVARFSECLSSGQDVAFVSDRGTPGISDPGGRWVEIARQLGAVVIPVPGPSSVISALSVCGWEFSQFEFHGFVDRGASPWEGWLNDQISRFKDQSRFIGVWLESPERIYKTLNGLLEWEISKCLGAEESPGTVYWFLAKEMTKTYENYWELRTTAQKREWIENLRIQSDLQKGEWVLVLRLDLNKKYLNNKLSESTNVSLQTVLSDLKNMEISAKNASFLISQWFGIGKKEAYKLYLSGL